MSVTISIQFLTGRAHLHHWQAHHSDGKVDWPPSPWRLLRALVAVAGRGITTLPEVDYIASTGKKPKAPRKRPIALGPPVDYVSLPDNWHAAESIDIIPLSRLTALLASLSCAPEVWLPKTSGGHTRQFFPIHEGRIVRPTGSAIFDSFAVVQKDQAICYHWPNIVLEPRDQRLKDLEVILQRMTYFGRAESWCQASVILAAPGDIDGVHHYVTHWPCICLEDGSRPPGREHHDYTLERKLAALPLDEVNGLNLASEVRELLPRTKRVSSARPKNDEAFAKLLQSESPDRLLLRCLLRESGQDMKDGLERPIGTRWVHYAVPRSIYDLPRPIRKRPQRRPQLVHVVRYSLNTATIHRPVLPPLTDTLLVADKFRSAALALYCAKHNNSKHLTPRNLCGREEDESLCRNHDHAFFWPLDEDNDGFIDHVNVYCPRGFAAEEVDALSALCRIRQRGGRPDLLVTPIYVGQEKDYHPWQPVNERGDDRRVRVFVSATPYFCPVHLTRGKGSKGRPRPISREIIKGLLKQGLIAAEDELLAIREIVFHYASGELTQSVGATATHGEAGSTPPQQYFPVMQPPTEYPPFPEPASSTDPRFVGSALRAPEAGFPFGFAIGLLVAERTRFIRAISFCRRRRHHETKTWGRMFQIEFRDPRKPQPFAIGDHCHFGLGLFVPATEHNALYVDENGLRT